MRDNGRREAEGGRRVSENASPTSVLLGFDFGLKRIGVATGQALTGTASPLTVLHRKDGHTDWDAITALLAEWRPEALVVGLPSYPDGTEQATTQACRRFARQLEGRYRLPVHRVDERYTSRAAQADFIELRSLRALRRRDHDKLDAVAAQRILENYLNDQTA